MKIVKGVFVVLVLGGLFFACSGDMEDTRSIEQIYKDEGVPVKTRIIQLENFKVERSYNAVLTGIEQSSAYAVVGDNVEKVFVKVGDYVEKDEILLTFPMNNPNAQYHQAKVAYENAKLAYERIANMYTTGGISKQQLDNAKASYDVAAANWDAAQQSVIVKAPISGYVTKVNVRESDNVKKDEELFTISRMNRMKARVWISEKDVQEVKSGMPAYAVWNDIRIEGRVIEVDMALDLKRQAFGANIEFDNPNKILKFDITVDVFIETYNKPDAIVVEMKDLIRENSSYFVYTVNNGKATKQAVMLGKSYQLKAEVLEGLKPGDEIVVEGQMLLEADAKIRIIK